jgi:uncharacterized protein involved in exopolysaccharide biosynthesis
MAPNELQTNLPVVVRQRGLGPRDIAFVLFRRRWIILAIAVPIILVGGGSLLGRTGTYTAAARVLVELQNVDQPRWNTNGRAVDYDRELSTLLNIGMSVSVAENAAVALADSLPVIRNLDPKLAELKAGADFRDYLMGGLEVNVVGESNILEFSHTAENPRVALMAVDALRSAFMQYENYGRRNLGAIGYYGEQVNSVRARIDSLLAVRGGILGSTGYVSLEDEMRYQTGAAAQAEQDLRKVQVDRQQLEKEYSTLVGYLEKDPREFPCGPDESRSSTLVGWRDLVGKHEDALNSILSVHTEDSLPARQQRAVLETSLMRLREEEVAYTESVHLALESTRQREVTLLAQLAEIKLGNRNLPDVYQRVSMLDSDIKSLRDLLDDLQGKWGEVRMSEMADDRVSRVVALTNPQIMTAMAGSKTVVYLVMVAVFGIALGLVGAFVQETLDHRIYAPRDVEDNLKLPVFASVSRKD